MKLPATSSVRDLESLNRDLETLVLQFHSVTELVRRTQALHDPQRILEASIGRLRIRKFELAAPSLEQIFIEKVGAEILESVH